MERQFGMGESIKVKEVQNPVICEMCGKTLWHNQQYCPLMKKDEEALMTKRGETRWDECVCLIHTCYNKNKIKKFYTLEQKKLKKS